LNLVKNPLPAEAALPLSWGRNRSEHVLGFKINCELRFFPAFILSKGGVARVYGPGWWIYHSLKYYKNPLPAEAGLPLLRGRNRSEHVLVSSFSDTLIQKPHNLFGVENGVHIK
jgi:hypothetical protein